MVRVMMVMMLVVFPLLRDPLLRGGLWSWRQLTALILKVRAVMMMMMVMIYADQDDVTV